MKRSLPLLWAAIVLTPACRSAHYDPADLALGPSSVHLETLAAEMVEPLCTAPRLGYLDAAGTRDDKRIVLVAGLVNRTREPIDRAAVALAIRTALLRTGKFRFTAREDPALDATQLPEGADLIAPLRELGRRNGAQMVLFGALRPAGAGRTGAAGEVPFQLTFLCVHVETGEVVWHAEEELWQGAVAGSFRRS